MAFTLIKITLIQQQIGFHSSKRELQLKEKSGFHSKWHWMFFADKIVSNKRKNAFSLAENVLNSKKKWVWCERKLVFMQWKSRYYSKKDENSSACPKKGFNSHGHLKKRSFHIKEIWVLLKGKLASNEKKTTSSKKKTDLRSKNKKKYNYCSKSKWFHL